MNNLDNRAITKLIYTRNYDIPVWVYDRIDENILIELFEIEQIGRIIQFDNYIKKDNVIEFFQAIRGTMRYDKMYHYVSNVYSEFGLLLFENEQWVEFQRVLATLQVILNQSNQTWTRYQILENLLIKSIKINEFNFQVIPLFTNLQWSENNILPYSKTTDYYLLRLFESLRGAENTNHRVKLAYLLNTNNDYKLSCECTFKHTPVLFKGSDIVEAYVYLKCVILSKYTGIIDSEIININGIANGDDVMELIYSIGTGINPNNLKYYYIISGEKCSPSKLLTDTIYNSTGSIRADIASYGFITDFNDLITICGHYDAGFPMELQKAFIEYNGDITTMFDESGKLLPEASIIKSKDMLPFIIDKLSSDDLYFLLYNSVDFVKNVISSQWVNMNQIVKILKALFEFPINEDLWNILNHTELVSKLDYRETIIRKFITTIGLDGLYDNVPEAMAYIKPNMLYLTRNMSNKIVRYVPVTCIVPSINQVLSRNNYTKLNRFCEGDYIPLEKVVDDPQFLFELITKHEQFAYLCDMEHGEEIFTKLFGR